MKTITVDRPCTRCHEILSIDTFYPRYKMCIPCCKTKRKTDRAKLKDEVLTYYSKTEKASCECCVENIVEFLSIDHINGGGKAHREEIGCSGGSNFYRWLRKNNYPEGFRVLCHNCNQAYGAFGRCPHQDQ